MLARRVMGISHQASTRAFGYKHHIDRVSHMSNQKHSWVTYLLRGFSVCAACGLIDLKNRLTERAKNRVCPGANED